MDAGHPEQDLRDVDHDDNQDDDRENADNGAERLSKRDELQQLLQGLPHNADDDAEEDQADQCSDHGSTNAPRDDMSKVPPPGLNGLANRVATFVLVSATSKRRTSNNWAVM